MTIFLTVAPLQAAQLVVDAHDAELPIMLPMLSGKDHAMRIVTRKVSFCLATTE